MQFPLWESQTSQHDRRLTDQGETDTLFSSPASSTSTPCACMSELHLSLQPRSGEAMAVVMGQGAAAFASEMFTATGAVSPARVAMMDLSGTLGGMLAHVENPSVPA